MARQQLDVKFGTEGYAKAISDIQDIGKVFDKTLEQIQKDIEAAGKKKNEALNSGPAVDQRAAAEADDVLVRKARAANQLIQQSFKELRIKSTADLEAQKASAVAAFNAIKNSGVASAEDIQRAEAGLKQRLEEIDKAAQPLGNTFNQTAQATETVTNRVNLFREGLQLLSTTFATITVGQLAQKFFDVGVGADSARRLVSTLTDDSSGLSDNLKQLSKDLDYTANSTDLLNQSYDVLSSGFTKNEEVVAILGASTKAAIGGNVKDAGVVVDALTTVLNSYSLSADQSSLVTDKFAQTVNAGKIRMEEYASGIGRIANTAKLAGVSFEEVNAVIGTATLRGSPVAETFTALQQAINSIVKPSEESKKLAKELGIEFDAQALKTKGLVGILDELQKKGATSADKLAVLFGSVEALRAISPLLTDGLVNVKQNLEAQANAAGTNEASFKKMSAGIGQSLNSAKNALQEYSVTLFEAFSPEIQSSIKGFVEGLKGAEGSAKDVAGAAKLLFTALRELLIIQALGAGFKLAGEAAYIFYSAITTATIRQAAFNTVLKIGNTLIGGIPGLVALAVLALGELINREKEAEKAIADKNARIAETVRLSKAASAAQIDASQIEAQEEVARLQRLVDDKKTVKFSVNPGLTARELADLEAKLATAKANLDALVKTRYSQNQGARTAAAPSTGGGSGATPAAPGTVAAVEAEIKALKAKRGELKAGSAELAALDKKIADLEKSISASSSASKALTQATALAKAIADNRYKETKLGLDRERIILDGNYSKGLIDLQTYYQRRQALVQRETAAQVEQKQAEIRAVAKENAAATTVDERNVANERIKALQIEIKTIRQKGATDIQGFRRDAGKAQIQELQQQLTRTQKLRDAADQVEEDDLRDKFANNEIGYTKYYERLRDIQQQQIDKKIAANESEIARLSGPAGSEQERTQNLQKINDLETENLILQGQREQAGKAATRAIAAADKESEKGLIDLQVRLSEGGKYALIAKLAQIDLAYRDEIKKAQVEGNEAKARILQDLQGKDTTQAQFDDVSRQFGLKDGELKLRQQDIQSRLTNGSIDQAEAQRELNKVNLEYADVLQRVYEQLLQLAQATGNPQLIQQAQGLKQSIDGLRIPIDSVASEINSKLQGGITQFFEEIGSGSKSAGDALNGLLRTFLNTINQIAAQKLAQSLFGTQGKGNTGGIGGFFSSLFGGGFREGGLIRGPGTGTSDSIPAIGPGGKIYGLSNEEYIIPAAAVRAVGTTFLDNLSGIRTPVRKYASGGQVGAAIGGGRGAGQSGGSSVRILNVIDPGLVNDYIASSAGERSILNIIERNPQTISRLVNS